MPAGVLRVSAASREPRRDFAGSRARRRDEGARRVLGEPIAHAPSLLAPSCGDSQSSTPSCGDSRCGDSQSSTQSCGGSRCGDSRSSTQSRASPESPRAHKRDLRRRLGELREKPCTHTHKLSLRFSGSPDKYDGRGKRGNDWKFNVLRDGGCYHCYRCGASGSWYDLRLKMSGAEQMSSSGAAVEAAAEEAAPAVPDQRVVAGYATALFEDRGRRVRAYLNEARGLDDATLVKYGVGFTTKRFFDEKLGGWREEDCATFPWVVEGDGGAPSIARVKLRSVEAKKNMRLEPAGGAWGLFGLHTVPDDCDEVVLCEGEYDAMAAHQATGRPALSVPNGASSLPPGVLPSLAAPRHG